MRKSYLSLAPVILLILCSICFVLPAFASGTDYDISLGQGKNGTQLSLQDKTTQSYSLKLSIGALSVSEKEANGQTFHELSIQGGELDGEVGSPAFPVISRLVAIPAGKTLTLGSVTKNSQLLEGSFRPMPSQGMGDSREESFSLSAAAYAADAGKSTAPFITIGEPALLRGVRVVTVTINPVSWDAATGELSVIHSADLEFLLTDSNDKNSPSFTGRKIPESFATMYENSVIGYEKTLDTYEGPGTWLLVTPNDTGIIGTTTALLEWRQRQGYNAIHVSLAETGSTNSQIKSYIQNLYDTLEIPLEFITFVGDADGTVAIPTFHENNTSYSGEGDHEYSRLEGNDVLADVHVGRISVSSQAELSTVINKIVQYETNPAMSPDPAWFTRAGLAGDPGSSGESTIWISQWLKQQLVNNGYTQIDTIWSGNFLTSMMTTINSGESIFTYRGYWNMSGMTSGHISSLTNGQELPFAVILTCDTGTFESDGSCRSEAFLRAANGGGVASIGTATTGTHTRYNNCMYHGIMENVVNSGDNRVGPALTRGKLNMYQNYNDTEPSQVETWSTWNNLMGDPATAIWTAEPKILDVSYATNVSSGINAYPVTVTSGGSAVAGARVTIFRKGQISVSGVTDSMGQVILPVSGLIDGSMLLTVYGTNVQPFLGGFNVGDVTGSVDFLSSTVDDDSIGDSIGNGDGLAAPGETLELAVQLGNSGTGGVSGVAAMLVSSDPLVTVVQNSAAFGYLGSGAQGWGDVPFVLSIDPAFRGGETVSLELVASSGSDTWTSLVDLVVHGPATSVVAASFSTGNLDPGDNATVQVTLQNSGNLATSGCTAVLVSNSSWVSITNSTSSFSAMTPGSQASNSGNPFGISVATGCYPGYLATFSLELTYAEGGTELVEFQETVGTAVSTDPVGPDAFGYYAIDNTDVTYENAPVYDWVEIDPTLGGSGVSVGLTDYARWDDDVKIMDLPFTFNYYGNDFDKISICSNGWLCMGASDLRHYRNWTIPSPGAPDNMIAAFWDDLMLQSGTGGVFTYYDEPNHRLIIEWSRVRTYVSSAIETFQVFLYDPAYYAGDRGEGRIVMQYNTVQMVDSTTGYATVGIQNQDRDDGVLYTYWNRYPGGAAALTSGRAIAFQSVEPRPQGSIFGSVSNNSTGNSPLEGATIQIIGSGRSLVTGPDGSYSGTVTTGTYDIAAFYPGFSADTTFAVEIGEVVPVEANFQLTDIGGPVVAMTVQPESGPGTGPYAVEAAVTDPSGIGSVFLYYTSSTTGGPFALPLTVNGDAYAGTIPAQTTGTRVQYWFTANDALGNASMEPVGAPFDVYSFVVTETTEILTTDMESDSGWTGGIASDSASSGIWTRVDPNAVMEGSTEVSPEDDHTTAGTMCWITGNDPAGGNQGVDDVDGGVTTLETPIFDISGMGGIEVSYYRWYTNDTGNSPGEDSWVVQASADGSLWVNIEDTNVSNRSWLPVTVQLEDFLTLGNQVQFRFVASDNGAGSVVEAGVDDFSLVGYSLTGDQADPVVALTSPVGGEVIAPGSAMNVTWNHSDDTGVVHAEISLSLDGGATFPTVMGSGAFNGEFEWMIPGITGSACRVKVVVFDAMGNSATAISPANFTIDGTSATPDAIVHTFALSQNAPNPFNPSTEIKFSLGFSGNVELAVYNIEGKLVRNLIHDVVEAGSHTMVWEGDTDSGAKVASGLYFYRLTTKQGTLTRKMTLLK